jgi:hypothetical protein
MLESSQCLAGAVECGGHIVLCIHFNSIDKVVISSMGRFEDAFAFLSCNSASSAQEPVLRSIKYICHISLSPISNHLNSSL